MAVLQDLGLPIVEFPSTSPRRMIPTEVKRRLGAKGYQSAPKPETLVLPMVADVPEPPRALGDAGLELWHSVLNRKPDGRNCQRPS